MKKTFNLIGAAVLGAAVLFGAESCNGSQNNQATPDQAEGVAAASTGAIVYVDMTKLLAEYQMAIDLSAEVQAKVDELTKAFENKKKVAEKELTKMENNFQTKANDYQEKAKKGHLTESAKALKLQELQQLEQEYYNTRSKKEQELGQEQVNLQNVVNEELFVMNNKVNDAINTFIQAYRVNHGYAMILVSQSDVPDDGATNLGTPVLAADPAFDITVDVLAGLNAEYNEAKN